MGQVDLIRRKVLVEGWSIRRTARVLDLSRNTIRKYLKESEPKRKETAPRPRPVADVVEPRIDQILEDWGPRTTPKQRITAKRVHRQLVEEGYAVGLTTVTDYLRELKRRRLEAFVPLEYRPGEVAQVDFFEVTIEVGSQLRKAWKFVMRLMYSGRDFARIYDRQDQVAFLHAHVEAFAFFGAVPSRIVYDNLKAAVKKVLFPNRELSARFDSLRRHYQFEPCFARPGEGHDKGGVESRGKTIRLQHLTPVPREESLNEINRRLLADLVEQQRAKESRFKEERAAMLGLPSARFDPRKRVDVVANRRCKVTVEKGTYSVPSTWKCLDVVAYVGIEEVEFVCGEHRTTVPRADVGKATIAYRHFLPELAKKPQALRQVAPTLMEELGEPYAHLWALLSETHGEREGSRTMAKILAAVTRHGEASIRDALVHALKTDQVRLLDEEPQGGHGPVVVPDALASYEVEKVSAAEYDELLLAVPA